MSVRGGTSKDREWALLCVALTITCWLGWYFKSHCTPGGWTGSEQYITGCYSDAVPFWTARAIDVGAIPYFESRMEYPVLTGALIWFEGFITRLGYGARATSTSFLAVVSFVNAAFAFAILRLFHRAGVNSSRLWLWAIAPPLVLYLGHNWDLLAIIFAVTAMLAARQDKLVCAAAWSGLGTAAKLWPALSLPLFGLAALFERDKSWNQRLRRATRVTLAAIACWVAVNAAPAFFAFDNWSEFYRFSEERGGTAAGTWQVISTMSWLPIDPQHHNFYGAACFFAGLSAILLIGWQRHRDHYWILFTPILAWFLLTNKVYSPQFDLWLYPLLLLTAPRLYPVMLFALSNIAAYFAEFWYFAAMEGAWQATSYNFLAVAAAVRALILIWLIVDALRLAPPGWLKREERSDPAIAMSR